jgi:hypothetical protein
MYISQFVEQLDITENSLFFGKKSMRFKSGDPLDIFSRERSSTGSNDCFVVVVVVVVLVLVLVVLVGIFIL